MPFHRKGPPHHHGPHGPHHGPHHGAHRHHRHHHGHGPHDRLIETLSLVDPSDLSAIEELARVAEEHEPDGEAAAFLRSSCGGLPPELALEQLAVRRREQAYRRRQALVNVAVGMDVAIVPPIPPYMFDMFVHLDGLTVLQLDSHELPPHLRSRRDLRVHSGPYESRRYIGTAGLVLFDAYADGATLQVRRPLADLLDSRILKPDVLLAAHFRPHPAPEDVEIAADLRVRVSQI